jgi:hypothetical protein
MKQRRSAAAALRGAVDAPIAASADLMLWRAVYRAQPDGMLADGAMLEAGARSACSHAATPRWVLLHMLGGPGRGGASSDTLFSGGRGDRRSFSHRTLVASIRRRLFGFRGTVVHTGASDRGAEAVALGRSDPASADPPPNRQGAG